MAHTRGGSSQRKTTQPRSLRSRAARTTSASLEDLLSKMASSSSAPRADKVTVENPLPTYYITPFVYNYLKSLNFRPVGGDLGDSMDMTRPFVKNWEMVEHDPQPISVERKGVREEIELQDSVFQEQTPSTPIPDSGSVPEHTEQDTSNLDWMNFSGFEDRPIEPEPEEGPASKEAPGDTFWVESASSSYEEEPLRFKKTRPSAEISNLSSSKRAKTTATRHTSQTNLSRRPRTRSSDPALPMPLPAEKTPPTRPKTKSSRPTVQTHSKTAKSTGPDETATKKSKTKKPVSRTVSEQPDSDNTPATKKAKPGLPPTDSYVHFLQKTIVRGKIIRQGYFREQGLGEFMEKLNKQRWLELFSDGTLGCSAPELAEFYANCAVTDGVVTSTVGEHHISFDAKELGELLGVPAEGYGIYVREEKTALGRDRLLELCRKFAQKPDLDIPRPVLKREMTPMHRLLYWFVIKNVVPRGQGRNKADIMDMVLVDLLDTGSQINLPALIISHISRMANTKKEHDLGYGFLLTLVFEKMGVVLQKRVPAQVNDEIGTRTLVSCGFTGTRGGTTDSSEQTPETVPVLPISGNTTSSSTPTLSSVISDQLQLKEELTAVKAAVTAEQALNAQRHEALLKAIADLTSKLTFPPS